MLSSEDAFSYAIAYREIWFELSAVSRRSAVGKKKGQEICPNCCGSIRAPARKNILGVGPMKANIDCELRPKKDRDHMGYLEAKRSSDRE